ncbi:MAG: hypothetical protein WCQ16_10135 [Verrucomicrobiae bacterium]
MKSILIALTANAFKDDRLLCLDAGMNALTSPSRSGTKAWRKLFSVPTAAGASVEATAIATTRRTRYPEKGGNNFSALGARKHNSTWYPHRNG